MKTTNTMTATNTTTTTNTTTGIKKEKLFVKITINLCSNKSNGIKITVQFTREQNVGCLLKNIRATIKRKKLFDNILEIDELGLTLPNSDAFIDTKELIRNLITEQSFHFCVKKRETKKNHLQIPKEFGSSSNVNVIKEKIQTEDTGKNLVNTEKKKEEHKKKFIQEAISKTYETLYHRSVRQSKGQQFSKESNHVCFGLRVACSLRSRYRGYYRELSSITSIDDITTKMIDGVIHIIKNDFPLVEMCNAKQFEKDLSDLWFFCSNIKVNTYCVKRLSMLQKHFDMYKFLNWKDELHGKKKTDFYSILKVDNHIHMSGGFIAQEVLEFIKEKKKHCPNKVVMVKNGIEITFKELLQKHVDDESSYNVEEMRVHADMDMFQRFDKFNQSYSIFDSRDLRTVLLKTNNHINGEFYAQLVNKFINRIETNSKKNKQIVEPRLSIYGRDYEEWTKLAKWAVENDLLRSSCCRWIVQFPRSYSKSNMKQFKENYLHNIFDPLFKVSLNPESNPTLATFLKSIVAIDTVGSEAKFEHSIFYPPGNKNEEPSYSFYCYYYWANLTQLNALRSLKGLNTFAFRPHCGEKGSASHLAVGFLLADSINHGIELKESPTLQYLYYLTQIGCSISPLSNNHLFLELPSNPFYLFFCRGLNVTLSTDDPLQFHITSDPLLEEYSVARQIWKLNSTDMSEIAHNSVLQSGLSEKEKQEILGVGFRNPGVNGNDVEKTNIMQCRVAFRSETMWTELWLVYHKSNIIMNSQHIPKLLKISRGISLIEINPESQLSVEAGTTIRCSPQDGDPISWDDENFLLSAQKINHINLIDVMK